MRVYHFRHLGLFQSGAAMLRTITRLRKSFAGLPPISLHLRRGVAPDLVPLAFHRRPETSFPHHQDFTGAPREIPPR